jgi:hypothetical protein
VKVYALSALCISAQGSAWDEVLTLVPKLVRGRSWMPSAVRTAIAYLVLHRGDLDDRAAHLAQVIERQAPKMADDDREWVASVWPDDGTGTSEAVAARWIAEALRIVTG